MNVVPAISMFFGIIIYMYAGDHVPPHFHARYREFEAVFDLNGGMIKGNLPIKQQRIVSVWAQIHSEELLANWTILQNKEQPFRIDPLR